MSTVLVCLALLFGVGGCIFSGDDENGEGYTGVEVELPDSAPGRDTSATLYYWIEPDYRCELSNGEMIRSYRGALQVGTEGFRYYSDFCQLQILHEGLVSDLTRQGSLIAFREGIFQREIP